MFWFQIRLGLLTIVLGFLGLVGLAMWVGKNAAVSTYNAVQSAPTLPASAHVSPTEPPARTPPVAEKPEHKMPNFSGHYKNGKWVESAAEKAYEKANGVEVIHHKDGSQSERKDSKKK